uniref:FATC domain-containing protein n=1 Tax=Anopheles dirus TaxID=7168 RepID=A0A182NSU8_9DIPT
MVWDAEQTGAAREELEQLIACLLEAALSEFLFDATVASLDRLVRQLVRLRLAGRATKAALYFLHRAPGAHDPWLAQLTDSVRALDELRPLLQAALDQWRDRTAALRNCLAWASAAHPPLCPPAVPGAFERASAARADATTDWLRAFDAAHRHARAVQRYERLRHCHDLADLSAALAAAGNRWRRKLAGIGPRAAITPTEELLVQLLDPEGATDRAWVSNLRALLDDMTDQLLTRIDRLERHEQTLQAALHAAGSRLVELCVAHENAAGDIRTLLRTQQRTTGSHALDAYLDRYHAFFELVRNVHRAIRTMTRRPDAESARAPAARTNPSSLGEVRRMVADLIDRLPGVFEQLFQFGALDASPLSNTPAELPASRSGEDGTRGDRLAADTMPEDVATQESQPVITSQCVQQLRNPHAVSVCDRIRRKLDGYDPDPAQRSSEQEQVDWIIKEAMDQGNLARLYHGWTPWV